MDHIEYVVGQNIIWMQKRAMLKLTKLIKWLLIL